MREEVEQKGTHKVEYEFLLHSIFHPSTVTLACFVKRNFVLDSDFSREYKGLQVGDQFEVVVHGSNISREDYALGSHDGYVMLRGRVCVGRVGKKKKEKGDLFMSLV